MFLESRRVLVSLTKNIRLRVHDSVNCFECIKPKNGNSDFMVPVSPEKIFSV